MVIDVLRAFTTAAFAFAAGAESIILVSTVEQALEIRKKNPGHLLIGEIDGIPIEGFDFGNSPSLFDGLNLKGEHLVQRTTTGTQGVIKLKKTDEILAASLGNAGATVRYLKKVQPPVITLVTTGLIEGGWGDEDVACADLIEARLLDQEIDVDEIKKRVIHSKSGQHYFLHQKEFPYADLVCALSIDKFNFMMVVEKSDIGMIMRAVND